MESLRTMELHPVTAGLDAPPGTTASVVSGGGQERLHVLLREATRLIEHSDLGRASEKLREAGELAAGTTDKEVRAVD